MRNVKVYQKYTLVDHHFKCKLQFETLQIIQSFSVYFNVKRQLQMDCQQLCYIVNITSTAMQPDQPIYQIFEYQIGGRTLMLRSKSQSKVLKKILNPNQYNFYQHIQSLNVSDPKSQLRSHLVRCHRLLQQQIVYSLSTSKLSTIDNKLKQWYDRIKDNTRNQDRNLNKYFLELDNFGNGISSINLVDLKVGKMPRRTRNPWAIRNNIKMIGMLKTNENGQNNFLDRLETGGIVEDHMFKNMLCLFFMTPSLKIHEQLLPQAISCLQDISLSFRSFLGWRFNSTSVCMMYDAADPSTLRIRVIDFGRVECKELDEHWDPHLVHGLDRLIQFLKDILANVKGWEHRVTILRDLEEQQHMEHQKQGEDLHLHF